ncbi:TetR/AcrR family transcriptional regulator [Tepidibacillus fermentans]|uniref:TetR family transcriptional regulator n=1 Tax=Tepidibacillus fermentans TaxID=1281767 RepID=A0A4R3KL51_9BACI|nr:TetR/AcrR family transcriptional regulator [Tepidibacillus fermentans]TCS84544.1 TetR family transcriptional regulator [Tepidibacillus fermentans]
MNQPIRKRMKKEEREQQILEAARKVFNEKGYNGATTIEIAQEAGITEVTLFRYFSSKQDMFMKAIEPILTETLQQVIRTSNGLSSKERIKQILQDRITLISKHYQLIKMVLMEDQFVDELPSVHIVSKMADLLKQAITEMEIPKEKEEVILRMVMGTTLTFLFMPENNEQKVSQIVAQMVESICIENGDE